MPDKDPAAKRTRDRERQRERRLSPVARYHEAQQKRQVRAAQKKPPGLVEAPFGDLVLSSSIDDPDVKDEWFSSAITPLQVELKLPGSLPELSVNVKPSAGVEIIRDRDGNVTGTRPRGSSVDKVAKALKGTQAGQSITP
jgi:valyl-tRNA synthetase